MSQGDSRLIPDCTREVSDGKVRAQSTRGCRERVVYAETVAHQIHHDHCPSISRGSPESRQIAGHGSASSSVGLVCLVAGVWAPAKDLSGTSWRSSSLSSTMATVCAVFHRALRPAVLGRVARPCKPTLRTRAVHSTPIGAFPSSSSPARSLNASPSLQGQALRCCL